MSNQYKAFRVGPLQTAAINTALGTELDPADVWVSKACHSHIALDHPEDYPLILANIVEIVRAPTFVGQDPKHGRNFYLVKRLTAVEPEANVLVAIGLTVSRHGTYNVRTAYRISNDDVNTRRLRGSLKPIPPK